MTGDTIAAVATPQGRAGIGIVRISGPDAVGVARRVVRSRDARALREPNSAVVGDLVASDFAGVPLDEVVVTYFRAPRSYTGEDVVEIACHGSPVILQAAVDEVLRAGARAATPGEFTLRAFLNGRIDLAQAEAVRDLIEAQTAYQAHRAQRQLRGELSQRLGPVKERLLDIVVRLESSVEFVEDDIEQEDRATLAAEIEELTASLDLLCASYNLGRLVADGATLAIVGAPNVGKSSIFNRLLDRDRAIVTPIPGTTRDTVSERLDLAGIPFRLVDTAGIRDTEDVVERIGVERTLGAVADADVVLVVFDAVASSPRECEDLIARTQGLRRVIAVNKLDMCRRPSVLAGLVDLGIEPLAISALTGENLERLRTVLVEAVGGSGVVDHDGILLSNARHHALLERACEQLRLACRALREGLSEEFALSGRHAALQ
jgi:tRNA modification GTPase